MSGSDKLCNNVTYLAKKRKVITEMNVLKNKLLEQQCMTIGEVTRQYLIEKSLYGNPTQSKVYWTDALQRAGSNRSWFATILDCYTELFDLLAAAKRCAMNATSGTLTPEARDRLDAEYQGIRANAKALLMRRVFEDRVTLAGRKPEANTEFNAYPSPDDGDSIGTTSTTTAPSTVFPPVEIQVGYNTYTPVSVNFLLNPLTPLTFCLVVDLNNDLKHDDTATVVLASMDADFTAINNARNHVMAIDSSVSSWIDIANNFIAKFDADIEKWKQDSIDSTSERMSALNDQLELLKIYMNSYGC